LELPHLPPHVHIVFPQQYRIAGALALGFPLGRKTNKIALRCFDRQGRTIFLFKMLEIANDRFMHTLALGELVS